MTNVLKTTVLLAALTALFLVIGGAIGGNQGLFIAFVFALLMNFASYWFSDKIVLSIYGAREVGLQEAPDLYRLIQRLAQRAGIPMPRVYIIPSDAPNAFATGRNPQHGAVAVTEGILRMLDEDELAGVLAHEMGHIRNRDTLIMTVAATLAGAITMLAHMAQWGAIFGMGRRDDEDSGGGVLSLLFMAILAPIAATLIQLAISRSREYFADSTGAAIAGSPSGLARALEKLHYASQRLPMSANPATAHLFIVNPLAGGSWVNLFSTHPPIEERIRRLRRR
ncbi:MAG TPA: zinc metalloprotease HtpX [Candidatus Tectomicrobia bacterium]|nr:zinc metalloprotease HtpX [Candidatus Tectomicrobia bacterium]